MAKLITNGTPGTTWANATGKVQYQLLVSWQNSCGLCCQYDRAIGPLWPTPFHRGCRCRQKAIWPGADSLPFVDFRAEVTKLDRPQQSRVIGRSNLVLVERGVIGWDDVVTSARVRSLREVVSRLGLTVDQLTKAGVVRRVAEEAHRSVNTPAHAIAEAERREAIRRFQELGVGKPQIKEMFGARMAARVGIAGGPSGPGSMPTPKPGPKPPVTPVAVLSLPAVRAKAPRPEADASALLGLGVKPEALAGVVTPVEQAVTYAKALGVEVEPAGHARFVSKYGAEEAAKIPASYDDAERKVFINEEHPYWKDPAARMAKKFADRWFSTDAADHVIAHEVGHALHHRDAGDAVYQKVKKFRFNARDRDLVVAKVGRYAAESALEFVAEVYAGVRGGKSYDQWVGNTYEKLKGP